MNKRSPSILLLACLSIVLVIAVACVPLPAPAPPTAEAPSSTLTNTVWQWTSVANRTTATTTTVPDPQDYVIIFRDDGTLSGQADCNTFTGTYHVHPGRRVLHHRETGRDGGVRRRFAGPAVL